MPTYVPVRSGEAYDVFDVQTAKIVARLQKTPWGKWKIVGEDTYDHRVEELVKRLERRDS